MSLRRTSCSIYARYLNQRNTRPLFTSFNRSYTSLENTSRFDECTLSYNINNEPSLLQTCNR